MTLRPIAVWWLLAVAGVSALSAQKPRPDKPGRPDTVALLFDWPIGLQATIAHTETRVRTLEGRIDTTALTASYRMVVQDHPRGRLVTHRDLTVPRSTPGATGERGTETLAGVLGLLAPGLVVRVTGEPIGLADAAGYVETMRSMVRAALDSLPADSLPAPLRAFMDRMLAPEVLTAQAMERWNLLVGFWLDARLERGEALEATNDEPFPLLPGVTLPYRYEFVFAERAPCTPGAREPRCVVLEVLTQPDSAAVRAALTSVLGGLLEGGPGGPMRIQRMEAENYIRLLTEPQGLIPHLLETEQTIVVAVQAADSTAQEQRQVRRRHIAFTYHPPRP